MADDDGDTLLRAQIGVDSNASFVFLSIEAWMRRCHSETPNTTRVTLGLTVDGNLKLRIVMRPAKKSQWGQ